MRKKIEEKYQDVPLLFVDGFDDAIVGVAIQFSNGPIVVYDQKKCVSILEESGLTPEEAEEYMDFNVTGAWMGEYTPMFLDNLTD